MKQQMEYTASLVIKVRDIADSANWKCQPRWNYITAELFLVTNQVMQLHGWGFGMQYNNVYWYAEIL